MPNKAHVSRTILKSAVSTGLLLALGNPAAAFGIDPNGGGVPVIGWGRGGRNFDSRLKSFLFVAKNLDLEKRRLCLMYGHLRRVLYPLHVDWIKTAADIRRSFRTNSSCCLAPSLKKMCFFPTTQEVEAAEEQFKAIRRCSKCDKINYKNKLNYYAKALWTPFLTLQSSVIFSSSRISNLQGTNIR